ncbi:dTDP-glucose pyrophosphorylase [Candidatus Methanoperedens nitroreducens]|uniref:dTDP-glucose pyrophosphorylase n=1 Tax=Candidatus Methanoperedens nitratireducens TaxID=1392998 RepID=A0A062V9Q4_9EURY|nr:sugar phosphate nucleotidyltransferase [Candidatus Methanoperedens nitroreducens]KCZ72085.1 dTDP-glucose pyrophosphorylase [Candidatus Methanoperedens nitroreducens]MDJ1421936.1 sugar phosphate nucleotidyltransferase [Candidatus Methanoperedens sp.]
MKIVIPAAGAGKRLFPHTFTKPKPMVYIAGKPIIGHILDRMRDIKPEEIILVVGYKKEQIMSYVDKNYSNIFNIRYVDQREQLGLGHSIYTARDEIGDSDIMIALGDMIFKAGYLEFYMHHLNNGDCSGSIGVREVDDPKKYGIVELDGKYIKNLEEKPANPKSNLGIAGVYFIREIPSLLSILEEMLGSNMRTRGEYQLTDALQEMVNRGYHLKPFPVSSWYDCGHHESLLETNRVLLDEKEDIDPVCQIKDSVIIQPVTIGNNVTIINSVVGPHASIAGDSYIESSIISDSVIGSRSHISKVNLQRSIVGDDASVHGKHNSLNIGDSSSIEF